MSQQQQNTIINGPAVVDTNQTSSPSNTTAKSYTTIQQDQQRPPPLVRLDSKTNLSPRLGYPNQQGVGQFRPQQPPRPQFTGNPQQYSATRPPLQRNPSSGQFSVPQNQGVRQVAPNPTTGLRPVTPYPRPQQIPTSPRSPTNLFPQKQQYTKTLESNPDITLNKDVMENQIQSTNIIEEEEPNSLTHIPNKDNDVEIDNRYITNNVEEIKIDEKIEDIPRPESRNQKIYDEEIMEKKSPSQSIENIPRYEEIKKVETVSGSPKISDNYIEIEDKKKQERKSPSPEPPPLINQTQLPPKVKSPSPEPPKSPRNHKMTLNFEERNRPRSPRLPTGKSQEEKSPTTPGRKVTIEKPKSLKPSVRSSGVRNGLIKSPSKSEGDNDSGVDESTQGNDQSSNGDHNSPRKSSGKTTARAVASPTKIRSLSRGSKSPNLKTPDSPTPSLPTPNDKKKIPMNKVNVGAAPSPNLKVVKSKIGSLQNSTYRPGGGNVKIEHKKIDMSKAQSKIAAKNETYVPGGGERKIENRKLQWNAQSKIGSLDNTSHKPKGGERKIESVKLDFKDKAKSKVGSKVNIKHQPGGGDVKIETKKLDIKAKSKIGSLDNMKHRPGGGDRKIFDDKEYLRQRSGLAGENNSLNGSQTSLPSQEAAEPVSDENLNRE